MKVLDLKKLLYVNLIAIAVFLPTFGGIGGELYAQDPELFNHTWYFEIGELDGVVFSPPSYLHGELNFNSEDISIDHIYCEESAGAYVVFGNQTFTLNNFGVLLVGVCSQPNETDFIHRHYSIYCDYGGSGIANNPFAYIISNLNNYFQLTIENGEGDWAVYNSVLLSTPNFSQNSFALYPNPVKETLHINYGSTHSVSATIYDINGKKLQSHSLEIDASTIDIKSLNSGLYFVVFESETGERVSKKFVKN